MTLVDHRGAANNAQNSWFVFVFFKHLTEAVVMPTRCLSAGSKAIPLRPDGSRVTLTT